MGSVEHVGPAKVFAVVVPDPCIGLINREDPTRSLAGYEDAIVINATANDFLEVGLACPSVAVGFVDRFEFVVSELSLIVEAVDDLPNVHKNLG